MNTKCLYIWLQIVYMIQMNRNKKMYGIILIILFGFSLGTAINTTKAMIEVDFYVAFLREQYPEVNALMIELWENYAIEAAEYGIQVNLLYISDNEAWYRFYTGNYDIIDFPRISSYYGDIPSLDVNPILNEIEKTMQISGTLVGVKGKLLVTKVNSSYYVTNLSKIIGHLISFSDVPLKLKGQKSLSDFLSN